jgi:hypothetical protein
LRVCVPRPELERGCQAVAEAEILGVPRQEAEANARLIAAAPELLAAIKVMVFTRGIRDHLEATDPMALEQARAAIARAKGEKP